MRLAPTLLALLAAALASCGADVERTPADPASWDLSLLPHPGDTLREVRTPSGAVYRVVREGEGAEAKGKDPFEVRVSRYGLDGSLLATETVSMPNPATRGLLEGVAGMRMREKRRVLVPAALGRRVGSAPGPEPDLVYDVERVPGVEVEDLRVGSGPEAKEGSTVEVHYKGMFADGSTFDSSYERGAPTSFEIVRSQPGRRGGVIEGWVRGIPGMRVGGMRVLRIPAHLAYGRQGRPPKIPPNADLRFVIELLGVK